MQLCSVSVDLDEIACYAAIHGLDLGNECHAVYDLALGRMSEFAASLDLPLTLFVVARDLERAQNASALRQAISAGHEVGNHSLDHFYDLTLRAPAEQAQQVVEASRRIETRLGVKPRGFRAPGYNMTDALFTLLQASEFSYDSSVFPCPAYYTAKATTLLAMKVVKRVSRSVLGNPNVLRAPTTPYRAGVPYWTRGTGLLEMPIQVAGPLRLPFIGTSLSLLGASGARLLTRSLLGVPFVNLELHGIDFLDERDVPKSLRAVQPDLRVPVSHKLNALGAALETLRARGYAFLRLDQAAAVFRA